MNPLFQAAADIQNTLQYKEWPFCFIGGLSVIRWGEIRVTQNIDLYILCGFGNEAQYATELTGTYTSRIEDPLSFAMANRVLLLAAPNGVGVDISLSGLPFEEEMIQRATSFLFQPGCSLITCSAEDLIVLKAFAARPKDWGDIEGIVMRSGKQLDTGYIIEKLTPLCELKESPEIVDKLKNTLERNI